MASTTGDAASSDDGRTPDVDACGAPTNEVDTSQATLAALSRWRGLEDGRKLSVALRTDRADCGRLEGNDDSRETACNMVAVRGDDSTHVLIGAAGRVVRTCVAEGGRACTVICTPDNGPEKSGADASSELASGNAAVVRNAAVVTSSRHNGSAVIC